MCVQHDYVYMDISIGGEDVGRLVIEVSERTVLTSLFYVKAASSALVTGTVSYSTASKTLSCHVISTGAVKPPKLSALLRSLGQ